ncbi:MAG: helix-turn-helix transcriptional regulator [Alphaproteobacteria bacterium]|nr:helix-turn-helix transcriptional regulator [Alphaproteobacteria bacterium]
MATYDQSSPRAIGALVAAERIRQGLTQQELAGLADVGVRFLVELEAGKETAALGKAIQVLAALGIAPRFEVSDETLRKADEILAEPDAGARRRHRVGKWGVGGGSDVFRSRSSGRQDRKTRGTA